MKHAVQRNRGGQRGTLPPERACDRRALGQSTNFIGPIAQGLEQATHNPFRAPGPTFPHLPSRGQPALPEAIPKFPPGPIWSHLAPFSGRQYEIQYEIHCFSSRRFPATAHPAPSVSPSTHSVGQPCRYGLCGAPVHSPTVAARGFWRRQGLRRAQSSRASDEHTRQGSVRSEQRRLRQKELPPGGLRRIGPVALLLLSHRALAAMLLRRASPQTQLGATNVPVFVNWTTKARQGCA